MNPDKRKAIPMCVVLCILSLSVMFLTLKFGKQQTYTDFTPPPFDPNACAGTPDVSPNSGYQELDVGVFCVSVCAKVSTEGQEATVWLTNTNTNHVWMKIRILDTQGNVLGESGLIRPGEYVKSVFLDDTPPKGTPIALKIMAYEPDTYYSAGSISLNTTIY